MLLANACQPFAPTARKFPRRPDFCYNDDHGAASRALRRIFVFEEA